MKQHPSDLEDLSELRYIAGAVLVLVIALSTLYFAWRTGMLT